MMKRDFDRLAATQYDALIVGGGITGACVAWDATLRGLRVALIEQGDFGQATSANSLKTIHGGLRYLQDADLGLIRRMVRERRAFLRIAPHLVRPLPVLMPTYRRPLTRHRLVLAAAVRANDLLSLDRNWQIDPAQALPNGRLLSRADCLRHLPGLNDPGITGGVLWHDAQMVNSERLLLAFVQSAVDQGAHAVNYARAIALLTDGQRVIGASVGDELTGQTADVRASLVVNCAGPWVDRLLDGQPAARERQPRFQLSTAINLVTRQIFPDMAVGLPGPDSQLLFIAPWQGHSLIGTWHAPYDGEPDDDWVTEARIAGCLAAINQAYPPANLRREDVYQVHHGFLPAEPERRAANGARQQSQAVRLVRRGQVTDHAAWGLAGLITAVGVKYTTARALAEETVDLMFGWLERPSPPCHTETTPLAGGAFSRRDQFLAHALADRPPELPVDTWRHLVETYGSRYDRLLGYLDSACGWAEVLDPATAVTRAEIIHAIRSEMAVRLSDVICRRTALGSAGPPCPTVIRACAGLMADELGWSATRIEREVDDLYAGYGLAAPGSRGAASGLRPDHVPA